MTFSRAIASRFFSDFFPPPRFLEMPAVGLDISDDAITVLELIRRAGAFSVGRFGRRAVPSGAIVGGEVREKATVAAELRRIKNELHLDFVNASLPEEKAYLFTTRIPRVPRKEIRNVLDFKLEDNVPIPAAEAIFDYRVVEETARAALDRLDVAVTVLAQTAVETYAGLLRDAGLTPLSFEIGAQAVARAAVAAGDCGTYLLAHFGAAKTGLFIVRGETVLFTATAPIGGNVIAETVARHFSLSAEEARDAKRIEATRKEKKDTSQFYALTDTLSALRSEVHKLSVYWRTHHDQNGEVGKNLDKIIITGKGASFSGFDDYLSLSLGMAVEVGNVWRNICSFDEYIPPIPFDESLEYAAAAGLALPRNH